MLNVRSSLVFPPITGMWLNRPLVHAFSGVIGMTVPSTMGPFTYGPLAFAVPCSARIFAADSFRRQAAAPASTPGQSAALAKSLPRLSARESGGKVEVGELW